MTNRPSLIYDILFSLLVVEALALVFFHSFAWTADKAMNKTDIGHVQECAYWGELAGYCFWTLFAAWAAAVLVSAVAYWGPLKKHAVPLPAHYRLVRVLATWGPLIGFPLSFILSLALR
jgi:hypothetical protein